jgi:uncharacterized protein YbaA (DUF1428 family)
LADRNDHSLLLVEKLRPIILRTAAEERVPEEVKVAYVNTFVFPVPKKHLDTYKKTARKFAKLWKEHGAVEVVECVSEDVKKGKVTSFPQSVQLKRTETVAISWVTFKSRKHRDKVMGAVMADPRAQKLMNETDLPVDGMRVFFGGFDVLFKL